MKKILRLVTTSVLTLTLVACGGTSTSSSSSSSSSSTSSSSVSSTSSSSTYAAVSSITLSAASDVLTQVMGSTKKVVVTAALNANTNPNVALEWYLNGVKSASQNGRTFEFTPTEAGEFKVVAKVGSVASNEILVAVGNPEFAIEELVIVDADTLEIKAPAGASVVVDGKELADSSYYSLTAGKYVVNLKSALAQGSSTKVTLKKEGYKDAVQTVNYDTRSLKVASVALGATAVTATDGVYKVYRPFVNSAATDTYTVTLATENIAGTLPYVEEVSVPEGAEAVETRNGLVAMVAGGTKTWQFAVTKTTVPGVYTYKYTLGDKVQEVKFEVMEHQKDIKFTPYSLSSKDYVVATNTYSSEATFVAANGVKANADGSYDIVKPYLSGDGSALEFAFKFGAEYFDKPANSGDNPNQVMVTVQGPNGSGMMLPSNSLPAAQAFAYASTAIEVIQKVDTTTIVGTYTYTIKVMSLGVEVHSESVVVNVKEPTAKLTFAADSAYDSAAEDGAFVIEKPISTGLAPRTIGLDLTIANYDSPLANIGGYTALTDSFVGDASVAKVLLEWKKSYSAPMTLDGVSEASKVAIELGSSSTTATVDDRDTTNGTQTYQRIYSAANVANKTLEDLFSLTVTPETVAGDYVYTIKIGELTQSVTVRVVEPTKRLVVAPQAAFVLNEDDGKYYTTPTSSTISIAPTFTLQVDNMAANEAVAYSLVKDFPSADYQSSGTVAVTTIGTVGTEVSPGTSDGNAASAQLLELINKHQVGTSGTTEADTFTAAGEYKYTITVAGITKEVTLVVLPYPTLKVNSVKVGSSVLPKFDGQYLTAADADGLTAKVSFVDSNLPAKAWVALSDIADGSAQTTAGLTAVTFKDGVFTLDVDYDYVFAAGKWADATVYIYGEGSTAGTVKEISNVKIRLAVPGAISAQADALES